MKVSIHLVKIMAVLAVILYLAPPSVAGEQLPPLDLKNFDLTQRPMKLSGPWEFYGEKLLTPTEALPPPSAITDAGQSWEGTKVAEGRTLGRFGYGTYRIRLTGLPRQNSGYEIGLAEFDGTIKIVLYQEDQPSLSWQAGQSIPTSAADASISRHIRIINFDPNPLATYVLLIQVSNFSTKNGGQLITPQIGLGHSVYRAFQIEGICNAVACGVLFGLGIYCFMMWYRRKEDKPALALGILSIICFGRIVGTTASLRDLFPDIAGGAILRVEFLSMPGGCISYLWFLQSTFSAPSRWYKAVLAFGLISMIPILGFSHLTYTSILPVYQIFGLICGISYLDIIVRSMKAGKSGTGLVFCGVCLVVFSFIFDLLVFYGILPQVYIIPIVVAIFLLMNTQIIAKRAANDYNKAEYLSHSLTQEVAKQVQQLSDQKIKLELDHAKLQELDQQKTHFFQNISHELRTPLTLILNTHKKMLKKMPDDKDLDVAHNNTNRLYRLVNQLLDFQRLDSTNKSLVLSPINLISFIDICGGYFGTATGNKNITVNVTIDGFPTNDRRGSDKIVISGETDSLEKVTFNFLSNAMKYSPTGGTIEFGLIRKENRVRLFVKDQGPGITAQDQEKLFKVFSQIDGSTTREYEGTGLGLALAKELTIKMGGEIGVESEVGKGSCFWAEFPLNNEWKQTLDILIVDDETEITELLKYQFISYPYRIKTANSVQQARALFNQYQIRVLITDQNMPDEDGVSLLAYMAKTQPQCVRLMFTGLPDQNVLRRAINEGSVQRVYYKPLEVQTLVSEILEFVRVSPIHEVTELKENFEVKDWLLEKSDSQNKAEVESSEHDEDINSSNERILVIDDLHDMRELIAGTLREQHFRTMVAVNGVDGLAKAASYKPNLIIVDWMMPKMSGPEFIQSLRSKSAIAGTPVILLTAKSDQESKLLGLSVGADAFLGKPFDEVELISTVKNMLRLKSGEQKIIGSLEDKNILVAMITHDIANPLTVTTSATEMLEMLLSSDSAFTKKVEAGKLLTMVKKASTSISSIISQVKLLESVDNKRTFEFEPVSITEALEESLFIVTDKISDKKIVIENEVDDVAVMCDKSALVHSVISNLLTNAIKFSEVGGKITCKTKRTDDNRIVIEIGDEGKGIPPEMQSMLFSIGHKTSRPGTAGEKGTGFGLPIVKKLITKMGGTITVESPYQRDNGETCSGAKFSVELPESQKIADNSPLNNNEESAMLYKKSA